MKFRSSIVFGLFVILLVIRSVNALDLTQHITQYGHTAWRTQDGAFNGTPNVVTQTTDGYIWIGTDAGLVKFDGVRFVPWTPPPGRRLASPTVYSLLGASDGSLWIGTGRRLEHWKNGQLADYDNAGGRINAILEDHTGTIWIARSRATDPGGGFCQVAGKELQCFGNSGGLSVPNADALDEDTLGNLWAGGSSELVRWKSGSWSSWFREELRPFVGLAGVQALAVGRAGTVWVGFHREGQGLKQLLKGVSTTPRLSGVDVSNLQISALFVDRNKTLWVGTENDGIYRVQGDHADHFRSEDGLSSNYIGSFYEDHEGNLWIVTSKGIDQFRNNRVTSLSVREGLTADEAGSVLAARDGTIWIGTSVGLDFLHGDKVSTIRPGSGLPGQQTTSLFEDHLARLWIGVERLLTIYERGKFRKINRPDGSSLGAVTSMAEDTDHNLWVAVTGRDRRLFRIRDMRVRDEFTPAQIPYAMALAADPSGGLWLGLATGNLAHYRNGKFETFPLNQAAADYPVVGLLVDGENAVWAASRKGLVRWKDGRMEKMTSRNGLPCEEIDSIAVDDQKALWAYASCGLIAIPYSELQRWWRKPDAVIRMRVLDVFDGALPSLPNFRPSASKSPDGRLWFANGHVVQMVDPDHLTENRICPPVHVEEVVADRKRYSPEENLSLPPGTRDIQIDYTALSFVVPQKVRFRYQLEGRDENWQDPGTRRQAFYTDLPPGSYRFHVIASNNDGLWNEAGAFLNFTVAPAYYQTFWFRLLLAGLAAAVLTAAYRWRVAQMKQGSAAQQAFTRQLIASQENERKRIAAELHDSLGQRLVVIKNLALLSLEASNENGKVRRQIEEISSEASGAIGEVKEISYNLRPYQLDRIGLTKAIESVVRSVAAASHIDIAASIDNIDDVFPKEVQINFYRIVQEALNNIAKHSNAVRASVEVRRTDKQLSLTIQDNGQGGAPNPLYSGVAHRGFGLTGMVERGQSLGGKLSIHSVAGQGTSIQFEAILRRET